jgi:hypothetical protein
VSGLLWLTLAYLWLYGAVTDTWTKHSHSSIIDLAEYVGRPGIVAIILFVSYVVGSFGVFIGSFLRSLVAFIARRHLLRSESEPGSWLPSAFIRPKLKDVSSFRRLRRLRRTVVVGALLPFLPIGPGGYSRLSRRVDQMLDKYDPDEIAREFAPITDTDQSVKCSDDREFSETSYRNARANVLEGAIEDVRYGDIAARLLVKPDYQALYQEYDRYRAEASLKCGIVAPGLLLCVSMAVTLDAGSALVVLITLIAAVFFFGVLWDSAMDRAGANDILAIAVGDGLISTPTLDRVEQSVEPTSASAILQEPSTPRSGGSPRIAPVPDV